MQDFSTRLKLLRTERGLRQKDLAAELGLAQTTIANYEQGTRFPDEAVLKQLADAFLVSLDFLLGRSETRVFPHTPTAPDPAEGTDPLVDRYLERMLDGRTEEGHMLVLEEAREGRDVRELYARVLEPVLDRVGDLWHQGLLPVAQEHYITAATERLMARLQAYFRRASANGLTAVGVAPGSEGHFVGLRMVLDFLELDGWNTYYVGGNIPTAAVIDALDQRDAPLLAVSVTIPAHINAAADLVAAVKTDPALSEVRTLIGGRAFRLLPERLSEFSADGYARNPGEAVEVARRLLAGSLGQQR